MWLLRAPGRVVSRGGVGGAVRCQVVVRTSMWSGDADCRVAGVPAPYG